MKSVPALLTLCLIAVSSGDGSRAPTGHSRRPPPDFWGPPASQRLSRRAYALRGAGKFAAAALLYDQGYRAAVIRHDPIAESRFLASRGGCELYLLEYRAATQSFLEARKLSLKLGDYELAAADSADLSSIYLQMFDVRSAREAAEQAVRLLPSDSTPYYVADLLSQLGWLYSLEGRHPKAIQTFERAIRLAPDALSRASIVERLGIEFQQTGDLGRAQYSLEDAFRARLLARSPDLFLSYYSLASLNLAEGNLPLAARLIARARKTFAKRQCRLPEYQLYYLRGRIRLAQGRRGAALADFRAAIRSIARWRREVLPADIFRSTITTRLQRIYDAMAETASAMYLQSRSPVDLSAAWVASETNRALGLRETMAAEQNWKNRLQPEYWETLARLRAVESQQYYEPRRSALAARLESRSDALGLRLTEMETRAGLALSSDGLNLSENNPNRISLIHFEKVLGPLRTLISFRVSASGSYRWVVTNRRAELSRLPDARTISNLALRFRSALAQGNGQANALGARLYSILFGGVEQLDAAHEQPSKWLVSLDGPLFEIPLAALVVSDGPVPVYLVERHSIQIIPGPWAVSSGTADSTFGKFLGIADAIYNTADPRFVGQTSLRNFLPRFGFLEAGTRGPAGLPRLPASGEEIAECARRWNGSSSTILEGARATWENFRAALTPQTAVIHIAAHFLKAALPGRSSFIALSLERNGGRGPVAPELVSAADIGALRAPGALVVLSGCASSAGKVLPGAGLMGLTRAWMAAGASVVLATIWATPDDDGLLVEFYSFLHRAGTVAGLAPAEALRRAQLAMLHSSTWRSAPHYWASYQVSGRSYRDNDENSRTQPGKGD
jgi:CHAT domain-containing protein